MIVEQKTMTTTIEHNYDNNEEEMNFAQNYLTHEV